jgi:hypothetical protein
VSPFSVTGTQRFSLREGKHCDRCGRDLQRQAKHRDRPDGLTICADCRTDRWFIERAAR